MQDGLPENHAGDRAVMRRILRPGIACAVIVALSWRAISELVEHTAGLRARGELAAMIAARRARSLARALNRAGLAPEQAPVYASVHVGAARSGDIHDIDDIGLLEGAMRRATRERIDVRGRSAASPSLPARPEPMQRSRAGADASREWSWLADDAAASDAEDAPGRSVDSGVPSWAVAIVLVGALATLVPLVRPLSDAAPWLALAGGSLVAAAWLAVRRR